MVIASPRLVERGYRDFACSYGAQVGADGLPRDIELSCLVGGEDRRALVALAENSVRQAVESMRFVPTGYAYCYTDVEQQSMFVMGESESGDANSYLDRLPAFCGQGD